MRSLCPRIRRRNTRAGCCVPSPPITLHGHANHCPDQAVGACEAPTRSIGLWPATGPVEDCRRLQPSNGLQGGSKRDRCGGGFPLHGHHGMSKSKAKIQRPTGLDQRIGFCDEQRLIPFRDFNEWVPWIWIVKDRRKWIIGFDPFEGNHRSKKLTPLGAAAANHIAELGDSVFNSACACLSSWSPAKNTGSILFQSQPTSYMQFATHSLEVACTVASRLLFLPKECYTDSDEDLLPDDPIHRILISVQNDSGTDVKPYAFQSEAEI